MKASKTKRTGAQPLIKTLLKHLKLQVDGFLTSFTAINATRAINLIKVFCLSLTQLLCNTVKMKELRYLTSLYTVKTNKMGQQQLSLWAFTGCYHKPYH